ncbi:MAG TPA: zinc ABC transporter substrate-binding protein [Alphaproteobacteria bacterium]|nr:zinc ABC transporter substrate-binding protein [Alphaproteobacteria bacterium]
MRRLAVAAIATVMAASAARAEAIGIVAAENFYGDVAAQIGGAETRVDSILASPDQDPHLFEATPGAARRLAAARLVIYNGADYDPWAAKLLAASRSARREVIEVAALVHRKAGENPHLWYDPGTMPAVAKAVADSLARIDPAHKASYAARLGAFEQSLQPLLHKIAALHGRYAGTPATATEPVFGYMAAALGLEMRNAEFQRAVMNDTEPTPREVAAFEADLRQHAVRVLIYNAQASGPLAERMRALAQRSGVPVLGVSETEPRGKTYQEWMLSQLNALDQALAGK